MTEEIIEIKENLVKWCGENNLFLDIIDEDDVFYKIGKQSEDVYMLTYPKEGKLFDKDVAFILDQEEIDILSSGDVKYIMFEFGTRFYYTKLIAFKNEFNDDGCYEVHFNDLKYIGKANLELDIPFVNLGVHSQYELLNGSNDAKLWVQKAVFLNQTAIGICDKNTLGGTMSIQIAAQKNKIKSVIGETVTVAYNYDPEQKELPETSELKLYATSEEGWQNLLAINTKIKTVYDGFIPEEELFAFTKGLICVLPTNSIINSGIEPVEGKTIIKQYKRKFEHIFYQVDSVELYDDKEDVTQLRNIQLYLSNYLNLVEPVLINDCYYVEQEMWLLKDYINKVSRKVHDSFSQDQHFKTLDETFNKLASLFEDEEKFLELFSTMCENTVKIADMCNFEIETGLNKLPIYENIKNPEISNNDFFFQLIENGIEKKLLTRKNIDMDFYMERISTEVEVIVNAGLIDYFLILWDIINWCKESDIYVGPGRGSVAGSLVAYLIDITEVDSIKHDLLFERFLNVTRFSKDTYYKIELENGETMDLIEGTKVKLTNGKEKLVQDLIESDNILIDAQK